MHMHTYAHTHTQRFTTTHIVYMQTCIHADIHMQQQPMTKCAPGGSCDQPQHARAVKPENVVSLPRVHHRRLLLVLLLQGGG